MKWGIMMGFKKEFAGEDTLLEIISSDENLEEYYRELPQKFKDEIKKKSHLIKSSEDLYQIIDYLIQDEVDNNNI